LDLLGIQRYLFSMRQSFVLLTLPLLLNTAQATTWTVGPGQTYTTPSQVSTLVGNGDTVNILAGEYPSDVARWQADDLVLRGVGGMVHLESNGNAWGGKAIWVIQGDRTTVEWIEFSECAVPDENGAGIRQEGSDLTVRHCQFHDNQNGILAGTVNPSTIRIEHCEFGYNGFGDGLTHNLYINNIDSLIFRYSYSHHAIVGHELKSRARVNVIEYNRFSNEADGAASREIDLPNGGTTYLIGNVIQQGPQGENSNLVGFGMEGLNNPGPHELYVVNNTLVNEKSVGSFFQMPGYGLLQGVQQHPGRWWKLHDGLAQHHRYAREPATHGHLHLRLQRSERVRLPHRYRITGAQPGVPGRAREQWLSAWWHGPSTFIPSTGVERCQHALLDAGAFETCTSTAISSVQAPCPFKVVPNPARGHITLIGNEGTLISGTVIRDAQGRLIQHSNVADRSLDISTLAPGMYLLTVSLGEGSRTLRFLAE
jgi:hypothetical protein